MDEETAGTKAKALPSQAFCVVCQHSDTDSRSFSCSLGCQGLIKINSCVSGSAIDLMMSQTVVVIWVASP